MIFAICRVKKWHFIAAEVQRGIEHTFRITLGLAKDLLRADRELLSFDYAQDSPADT
jgi:hypothetical protein